MYSIYVGLNKESFLFTLFHEYFFRAVKEHWPFKLKEFMNVDVSVDINKLSEKIIKHAYPKFNGIFYREYMPMSLRVRIFLFENHTLELLFFTFLSFLGKL